MSDWESTYEEKHVVTEDGTRIAYEVLGEGDKALVFANGLGGRLYAWTPAVEAFSKTHRIITWDYRGLFGSESPASKRHLSITHHAQDLRAILDAERVGRAVVLGWSMGVQVALDFAASFAERVAGLVLLNGTYGHVFSTGFQPLVSIPFLPKRLHTLLDWLQDNHEVSEKIARVTRHAGAPISLFFYLTAGARARELAPLMARYMDDVLGPSFPNYLRLFQELDAHSTYHLLRFIEAPALVIAGMLDTLTPAYQSREIARRLPNAELIRLWRSSHFSMMERPEVVIPAMQRFFDARARW